MTRVVGHILRNARKRRGLSQERLASVAGFTRTTVLNVEHGRHDMAYLNVRRWLSICEMTWRDFGDELQAQDVLPRVLVDDVNPDETVQGLNLDPLQALGAAMRAFRRVTGKSFEGFINDSGLDRGQLSGLQRGERNVRLRTLRRALKGLGVNWQQCFALVHQIDAIPARSATPR